jgi:hypothetical protein
MCWKKKRPGVHGKAEMRLSTCEEQLQQHALARLVGAKPGYWQKK